MIARLDDDPDWLRRRDAQAQVLAKRSERLALEQESLLRDLLAVGISIDNVWDLVNTATPYPHALPVLLDHLEKDYHQQNLEGIARALAVKDARSVAWDRLITLLRARVQPENVAHAIMVAISAMARPSDVPFLLALITASTLGTCRIYLVRNLIRSRRLEAQQTLHGLRNDPDLTNEITARLKDRAGR